MTRAFYAYFVYIGIQYEVIYIVDVIYRIASKKIKRIILDYEKKDYNILF